MKSSLYIFTLLCVLVAAQNTQAVTELSKYDTWDDNFAVQALVGAAKFEDLKFDIPDSDGTEEIDNSAIPQLGGAWSTLPTGERFQYGLECSFLLGFRFDEVKYAYLGPGGSLVVLETSMWMFDLAGGVYTSYFIDAGRKVRVYVAGGPLVMYADYDEERDFDDDSIPDEDTGESAFGIGAYARTGIELRIHEAGMLGVGIRATWASIDFSDVGGTSNLSGGAAFITYTAGF